MNSAGQASQTVGQASQTAVVFSQIAGVIRLELKKTFLSRRGWWVYLLALAPVGLALLHSVSMEHFRLRGHNAAQDAKIFAAMFQTYFLHLGIFFGCVGIFTNLFRAEMLEKTLHYYFLTPIRREWLVTGKYLTGLLVAAVLFPASAGLSMYFMGRHQGAAWSDFLMHGPGLAQLLAYMMIALLASIGYGAVFLTAGLLFRNPMIPAAVVWVWENLNPFLPSFLKKISVIFYLRGLAPVSLPGVPPPLSFLVVDTDPIPGAIAVPGLLLVALAMLVYAGFAARKAETAYSD